MPFDWPKSNRNLTSYDTRGRATTYQYDTFGRMTAVVLRAVLDPKTGKTVNPTTVYGYDGSARSALLQGE